MAGTKGRSGVNLRTNHGDSTPQDGVPEPAPELGPEARKMFALLLEQMHEPRLRRVDQHQLSILSSYLVRYWDMEKLIAADPTNLQACRYQSTVAGHIHKLSQTFGLTPEDRARLTPDEQDGDGDFEDLVQEYLDMKGMRIA